MLRNVFLHDPEWGSRSSQTGGNGEGSRQILVLPPFLCLLSAASGPAPSSLCQPPGIHLMVGLGLHGGS